MDGVCAYDSFCTSKYLKRRGCYEFNPVVDLIAREHSWAQSSFETLTWYYSLHTEASTCQTQKHFSLQGWAQHIADHQRDFVSSGPSLNVSEATQTPVLDGWHTKWNAHLTRQQRASTEAKTQWKYTFRYYFHAGGAIDKKDQHLIQRIIPKMFVSLFEPNLRPKA